MKLRNPAITALLSASLMACSGGENDASAGGDVAGSDTSTSAATSEEAPLDPMETKDGIAYASLTGDPAAGKVIFAQCRSCHVTDAGIHRTGPSLAGIIGARAGAMEGYNYTPANAESGLTWSEEQMYVYLENPRRTIPGTKMAFVGLHKAQHRADVIAYLKEPH